ncbi:DMT family transporter [Alkalilimnicola ehrlichii]|nr:DMT family transporter [Alkalilimnicola ehrlichii]
MFNPLSLVWNEPDTLIGAGLILLATLVWTLGLVHVRRHHWQGDVLSLMPWQLLCSVAVMLPIALALESPSVIRWESGFFWNLLLSGTAASGLAVAAQVAAMRALPAVSLSLSSAAVPAVGVMASVWVLAERPTVADIIGFLLIAGGILTVALADRRAVASASPVLDEQQ